MRLMPADEAKKLARHLTDTDDDGWTYFARCTGNGMAWIEVHDENGHKIADM